MEFVEGQSLAELVHENPLPPELAAQYLKAVAEAIYWMMTVSTTARALAEIAAPFVMSPVLRLVIAAGGLGQLAGVRRAERAVHARRVRGSVPTRGCRSIGDSECACSRSRTSSLL